MLGNTRTAGSLLVFLGAVLLLSSTAAFDTTEADRTASVTVPADHEAYLGIDELSYGVVGCNMNANTPAECVQDQEYWETAVDTTNLFSREFDSVEVEIQNTGIPLELVDGEAVTHEGDQYGHPLAQGQTYTTGLVCGQEEPQAGTDDVELRFTVTGPGVSIEADYVLQDVEHDCTGGQPESGPGFSDVIAEDADPDTTTQQFRFTPDQEIRNNDAVEIRLTDVNGIDYSGATATEVTNEGRSTSFDPATDTITWHSQGKTDAEVVIELTGVAVTDPDAGGGRAEFERMDNNEQGEDFFGVE